jgi:Single-stranded DNA-binding protein
MEQLNKATVRGTVGNIRITEVGGTKVARMTVATNYAYRAKDGSCVIETTWHQVTAWEGERIHSLEDISRGDRVEVEGRIRNQRFTGADGEDHTYSEILAGRLAKIVADEPLQYQI